MILRLAVVLLGLMCAPALAYVGDSHHCPTHNMEMVYTGQTKFEDALMYELYRCAYGDTWWFPSSKSEFQPQVIEKQDRAQFGNPITPSWVQHPCPICGQEAIYSRGEVVGYRLKTIRHCLNNHDSVWDR